MKMRYVFILVVIFLTFGLLFTASSGVLKGQALGYQQEERDNYYYADEYLQGYDRGYNKEPYNDEYLQGYDKDSLYELDNEFLEGIDKKVLLNIEQNLLKDWDFEKLSEQSLQGKELELLNQIIDNRINMNEMNDDVIGENFIRNIAFYLLIFLIIIGIINFIISNDS